MVLPLWISMFTFLPFAAAVTNSPVAQSVSISMAYDGSIVDEHQDAGHTTLGMRSTEAASAQDVRAIKRPPEVRRVIIRTAYDGSTFDDHDDAGPGVRRTEGGSAQEERAEYSPNGMRTRTSAVDVRRVASRGTVGPGWIVDVAAVAVKFSTRVRALISAAAAEDTLAISNLSNQVKNMVGHRVVAAMLAFVAVFAVMLFLWLASHSYRLRFTHREGNPAAEAQVPRGNLDRSGTIQDGKRSRCAHTPARVDQSSRPHTRCANSKKCDQVHGNPIVAVRVPSEVEVVTDTPTEFCGDTSSDSTSSDEEEPSVAADVTFNEAHASQPMCTWSGRLKIRSSRF